MSQINLCLDVRDMLLENNEKILFSSRRCQTRPRTRQQMFDGARKRWIDMWLIDDDLKSMFQSLHQPRPSISFYHSEDRACKLGYPSMMRVACLDFSNRCIRSSPFVSCSQLGVGSRLISSKTGLASSHMPSDLIFCCCASINVTRALRVMNVQVRKENWRLRVDWCTRPRVAVRG